MSTQQKAVYQSILGRNPIEEPQKRKVVVVLQLPRLGEHDFQWKVVPAIGKEYGHYGFRLHPKANPVNIQVYGDRKIVENLAQTGKPVVCELELLVKRLEDGREYLLTNLYLTKPWASVTHEFRVTPAPKERPSFVYTTNQMFGTGVAVRPL